MSVVKDASMTDITVTQPTVEPECLQITKRRNRKRVARVQGSTGDSVADVSATAKNSDENNTCGNEAEVRAYSKNDSERTKETESTMLQEGVKNKKKQNKRVNNLQPITVLPSQEEVKLGKEGGKKQKRRKKDLSSPEDTELFASKDEELDRITQICRVSQADLFVTDNTVCATANLNEDEVDADSKKDLIKPKESSISQKGGKKKKKKRKEPKETLDGSQLADLVLSLGDGCLEKAQNIGSDQACVSATENTLNEENSCVDEHKVDVHSKDSNIRQADKPVTSQATGKRKKRKKAMNSSQPAELFASQEEGSLEKMEKVDQPENSETRDTILETCNHLSKAEMPVLSKTESCSTRTAESAILQMRGKKSKKEDLNSPCSTESTASQENGTLLMTQTVSCDLQDITLTETFIGKDADAYEIDANLIKDTNSSKAVDLVAHEKRKKHKKKQFYCVQPMQICTPLEEGKRSKKRKKDSIGSHPEELHASEEKEVLEKISSFNRDSQPGLSAEDKSFCVKRSSNDENEIVMNEKIDAPSFTESIELQKEGKNERKDSSGAQLLELFSLQDGGKKKRKKHLQHLNPSELSVSEDGGGGKKHKYEQNNGNKADAGFVNSNEIMLTQEEKIGSQVCLGKVSTEKVDGKLAELVSVKETMEVLTSPETPGKVSAEKCDGNEDGFDSIRETIELSVTPKPISRHISGNHFGEQLIVDVLNRGQESEQNTSMKTKEFVSTDIAPSNFLKVDVASEDVKKITEGEDGMDKITRRSLECLNNAHASGWSNWGCKNDGNQLELNSSLTGAVRMTGVEEITTSGWSNWDCAYRESKKRVKTKTYICGDDCSQGGNPQAAVKEKKQKNSSKDGILTSKDGEDAQADDAVKGLVEVKGNSGPLQKQSGSLTSANNEPSDKDDCDGKSSTGSIKVENANYLLKKSEVELCSMNIRKHDEPTESATEPVICAGEKQSGSLTSANNEPSDKDDCDGKSGTGSIEVKNANYLLKKSEVELCSMNIRKHDEPTESATESVICAGEKPRGDSDEGHSGKLVEDLLIEGQAVVHSASLRPLILTESAEFDCLNDDVMCGEFKRTSTGGNEASGQCSEDPSNGDQLGKHYMPVKGLEMTTTKSNGPGCSNLDVVIQKESKKTADLVNGINMNDASENKSISQVRIPSKGLSDVRADRKLLILDVNGLLADIIPNSECPTSRQPDLNVSQKLVYERPFCRDFLSFCFKNFVVGVWSSRTWKNLERVVKFLFGSLEGDLVFCWDRSYCTHTGVFTVDNPNKPLVLKELRMLWKDRKALPRKRGFFYDASNTLLLDDSPYKALRNPVHTAIFPHSYKCTDAQDSALGPEGELRKYLKRLAVARNVQEFVSHNRFGQGPITASHPSWPLYRKIIIGD